MNPTSLITGVLYLALLFVELRQWNKCHDRRAEIIGWVVLSLHVALYTGAYIFFSVTSDVPALEFNTWSSALRLHGAITILTISIARCARMERRNGC